MTMGDEVWRLFPNLSLHGTKCSVKGGALLVGFSDPKPTGQLTC